MPEQATQRLAEILGRLRKLGASDAEPPQFFAGFLQLTAAATGSQGGGIWLTQPNQAPQCYCHLEMELSGVNSSDSQRRLVLEAVSRTVKEERALVVPPAGTENIQESEAAATNECGRALFFYPLRAANQIAMVLQLIAAPELDPQDYRAVVQLTGQAAEAAETYLAHRRTAVLEDDRKALARLLQYAEGVHGSLDAEKVIYQVANLGREAIGCKRVVVWVDPTVRRGLRAVSGVDKPDRRAVLMQQIEKLGRHCLREGKPLLASRQGLVELPEEEESTELLKSYFNISQMDQVYVQPMEHEGQKLAVLVAEGFEETGTTNVAGLVASVAKHGGMALANALAVGQRKLFARKPQQVKTRLRRRRRVVAGALVIVGLVVMALLAPWTIQIDADCRLTPKVKRLIDAPLDGEIAEVVRPHGQVAAGEVILRLNDADLQAQLRSLQSERAQKEVTYNRSKGGPEEEYNRLEVERLARRIELVELQLAKCEVRSPIDGRILTQRLELREGEDVRRGDELAEVADLGQWELVLEVPQEEIGWVQRGLADGGSETVEFFLQSYPEKRLWAQVTGREQISEVAQSEPERGNYFTIRVDVAAGELQKADILKGLGDGSTGAAKIATVRRPLGYALVRKVVRFFRVTFF